MTNIIPFERKKSKYKDLYTVDINLLKGYEAFERVEVKRAYSILEGIALLTSNNHLKSDVNCVLGYMRDEFKWLRDDLV
jgi:hypothetical protein